jgi:RNA polymerase sigma factor (TIGR02999 family)
MASTDSVAALMGRFRRGDSAAAGELIDLFYPQLKQLAASRMRREAPTHSWQPTLLVNELYLELVKIRALRAADSTEERAERDAFLKLSAHLMKRLLIHHTRPLSQQAQREAFDEQSFAVESGQTSLLEIEDVLDRLADVDPMLRSVVELRVFEGLTGNETAARLGCSPRTEARHWNFARNWLAQELPGAGLG